MDIFNLVFIIMLIFCGHDVEKDALVSDLNIESMIKFYLALLKCSLLDLIL